jgi:hypothetical protein
VILLAAAWWFGRKLGEDEDTAVETKLRQAK